MHTGHAAVYTHTFTRLQLPHAHCISGLTLPTTLVVIAVRCLTPLGCTGLFWFDTIPIYYPGCQRSLVDTAVCSLSRLGYHLPPLRLEMTIGGCMWLLPSRSYHRCCATARSFASPAVALVTDTPSTAAQQLPFCAVGLLIPASPHAALRFARLTRCAVPLPRSILLIKLCRYLSRATTAVACSHVADRSCAAGFSFLHAFSRSPYAARYTSRLDLTRLFS